MIRHHLLVAAALAALCAPAVAPAQAVVQPLGPSAADDLAAQMRILATDPRNVQALCTAGELSMRIGDLSGAAALFARADKVDPRSGRVKAGMASILVRSERPGEALRFFSQAEAYGYPAQRYAADRGLAFDLVGQQGRAQADYRLALGNGADDETTRRYALSLGISGNQPLALEQLDPLVRKQDRAAWRARAFVMAMNGDTTGAAKIATTMMPAGMAQGLAAFFQRLPTLGATDRAFAVHFGEITATPERVADARMTPQYAPLAPTPVAPVQVAAVQQPVAATDRRSRRERERDRRRDRTLAPAVRQPVQVAAAVQPEAATMREANVRVAASPITQAQPVRPAIVQPVASTPVQVAAVTPRPAQQRAPAPAASVSVPASTPSLPTVQVATATPPVIQSTPPVQVATATPSAVQPDAAVQVAAVASRPIITASIPASTPVPVTAAATPVAPVRTEAATERADSVLARIVASLSIPASELGVVEPARPDPGPVALPPAVERAPASGAGRRVVAQAAAQEVREATVRRTVAVRLTGDAEADEPAPTATRGKRGARLAAATPATARGRRGVPAEDVAPTDEPAIRTRGRKTAAVEEAPLTPAQRRAADRKAAADKKAAAEKKELADKAAADKKAARAQPSRIWVQVAGGANEGDLGKAWASAQAKSPALKGRAGYKTPLRATNRVLTGPFKTDAEARAFVNQLNKQGVSAFSFTSDSGQKVEKLGAQGSGK